MAAIDNANEKIDQVLQEWAPYVVQILAAAIEKRKLLLTEDLLHSFRWDLLKATADSVAQGRLYFKTHGRWKDMRTIRNQHQPPVDALIQDFVKKVGISKFKYVPGYKSGSIPSENIAMRRIAWGISKGLLKRNTSAARKWYASNFYNAVNVLIEKLLTNYQQVSGDALTQPLKNDTGN